MLDIPTVINRTVQQAILQVLSPMLDLQMSESSNGFRPRRKAHDAVNHDILMERLARRIKDKHLLWYIRQVLKVGMMDNERIEHLDGSHGVLLVVGG